MQVFNTVSLTPAIEKLHVAIPSLTATGNLVGVENSLDTFVMVKGDNLYLSTIVNGTVLTLDFYTMVTGTAISNIDIVALNDFNILLRYDDGVDTHYRCFTIFDTSLVLTYEESSLYTGEDGYIDELHNLTFLDGVLRKIVYKNNVIELTDTDVSELETSLGETITKAELAYNSASTFIFLTTATKKFLYDNVNEKHIELGSTSSVMNTTDKIYILTETNNEIAINNTN